MHEWPKFFQRFKRTGVKKWFLPMSGHILPSHELYFGQNIKKKTCLEHILFSNSSVKHIHECIMSVFVKFAKIDHDQSFFLRWSMLSTSSIQTQSVVKDLRKKKNEIDRKKMLRHGATIWREDFTQNFYFFKQWDGELKR